ncbi:MAG: archaellin/type IV pilin N-terminal domain-containing protein [Nitrososphaerales archaeon]|jgi:hypothetical protein
MKLRGNKKRLAIAEIMGTLIMVAITLVAGTAVFGWVNGQAGSSENAYGQSVASNVNFLRESFSVIATIEYSSSCPGGTCQILNITLYNRGEVTLTVSDITIAPVGATTPWIIFNDSTYGPASCLVNAISPDQKVAGNLLRTSALSSTPYQVTIPACDQMNLGQSYDVTIQGLYGNVIHTQVRATG